MRGVSIMAGTLLVLMTASCGGGPSEQDIRDSLQDTLDSAAGGWTGTVSGPNGMRLDFSLQQAGNGQLSGSGTMKEENAPAAVPITVSGTFQRPVLTLSFNGMVYEGHAASGAAAGNYTTVGGVGTTLTLTGAGYTHVAAILLQEKP